MKILRIRMERINMGWSLEYVAKQIGITNQSVSLIEKGQNKPSYDVLCKLENLFNLTHRQLFAVVDDPNLLKEIITPKAQKVNKTNETKSE